MIKSYKIRGWDLIRQRERKHGLRSVPHEKAHGKKNSDAACAALVPGVGAPGWGKICSALLLSVLDHDFC